MNIWISYISFIYTYCCIAGNKAGPRKIKANLFTGVIDEKNIYRIFRQLHEYDCMCKVMQPKIV